MISEVKFTQPLCPHIGNLTTKKTLVTQAWTNSHYSKGNSSTHMSENISMMGYGYTYTC